MSAQNPTVRFTPASLRRVGVELVSRSRVWLRCVECGGVWSPNLRRGGRLPRGWWKCPHYGCNQP